MNSGRLRPEVSRLLDETNRGPGGQVGEAGAGDAVAVKIDKPTILGLDTPKAALSVKFADAPVCGTVMCLDVEPPFALVVLELAPGGAEGIAQGNVRFLVRLIGRVCPSDCDGAIGDPNVDMEVE